MNAPVLKPPFFEQIMLIETYRDGYKASLTSAIGTCEQIATAAFSIATAYGALIALVTPKDAVNGLAVAAPIIVFAAAAVTVSGDTITVTDVPQCGGADLTLPLAAVTAARSG